MECFSTVDLRLGSKDTPYATIMAPDRMHIWINEAQGHLRHATHDSMTGSSGMKSTKSRKSRRHIKHKSK